MCKVKDVALAVLQKSIDLARTKADIRYRMDSVKLHKMLYLGQCMVLSKYNMVLFQEQIYAHHCGPYIEDELDFIAADYGFDPIKTMETKDGSTPLVLPLPHLRNEVVDLLLDKFGQYSTQEIVDFAKNTSAYSKYAGHYDKQPPILPDDMKIVGDELFN